MASSDEPTAVLTAQETESLFEILKLFKEQGKTIILITHKLQGSPALWRLAVDGITSFSTAPLRIWSTVGLLAAFVAILSAIGLAVRVLIFGRDVPGYASLMVVTLFCFAVQMVAFGIMGEYLGRLYQEAKGRPIYILRNKA